MDPGAPSPNILLTNACLRSCAYCFAGTVHPSSTDARWMAEEDFAKVLDWLESSGVTEVRLLGGEPLLHPQFGSMLEAVELRGGFSLVRVFSSMLAPVESIEKLVTFAQRTEVRIVANIAEPDDYDGAAREVILGNLATMVDASIPVTVGLNIHGGDQDVRWLVAFCQRHGIENVRVAIASPADLRTNTVPSGGERLAAGELLASLVRELDANRIAVSLDCLVTPCLFTNEAWAYLSRALLRDASALARCCPALDISVDLWITRCFGTGGLAAVRLEDFDTTQAVWKHFIEQVDGFRRYAAPRTCRCCSHFAVGHCSGGCMGFIGPSIAAARVDSERAGTLISSARNALRSYDFDHSIEEFERAFELSTHDGSAVCDYIAALISADRIADAMAAAGRHAAALDRAPGGLAAFVRGMLTEARGDHKDARGYYRLSLRHADGPHRDHIRNRLERTLVQEREDRRDDW